MAVGGGTTLTGTGTLTRFPDNSPDEIVGSLSDERNLSSGFDSALEARVLGRVETRVQIELGRLEDALEFF